MSTQTRLSIAGAALCALSFLHAQAAFAQQEEVIRSPAAAASIDRPDHPAAAAWAHAHASVPAGRISELIQTQNAYRTEAGRKPLTWSQPLADEAGKMVSEISESSCSAWGAGQVTSGRLASFYWAPAVRGIGGSSSVQDLSARYIVSEIVDAGGDYVLSEGYCSRDTPACRAYAFMIHPASRRVGCDYTICNSNAQVWVCRYEGDSPVAESIAETAPG